jgi:UDP-N-acetylglucosamine kinase
MNRSSLWRVSDPAAYSELRSYVVGNATGTMSASGGSAGSSLIGRVRSLRARTLGLNAYDRSSVEGLRADLGSEFPRSANLAVIDVDRRGYFESAIAAVLAPEDSTPDGSAVFVVLMDDVAPGPSRLTTPALALAPGAVVVGMDELRALHPNFSLASTSASVLDDIDGAAREWRAALLGRAREDGRSVILDGWRGSLESLARVVTEFGSSGFRTVALVSHATRAQALLAELETGMAYGDASHPVGDRARLGGLPSGDLRGVFDEAIELDGRGQPRDSDLSEGRAMSTLESMHWLSSLRRIHEHVAGSRRAAASYGLAVAELHRLALREVLPSLNLPSDSAVAEHQRRLLVARATAWERGAVASEPFAAPSVETESLGI